MSQSLPCDRNGLISLEIILPTGQFCDGAGGFGDRAMHAEFTEQSRVAKRCRFLGDRNRRPSTAEAEPISSRGCQIEPGAQSIPTSYQALKTAYVEMANFQPHVTLAGSGGPSGILNSIHETMDLNTLLRIEKQTVEP